MDLRANFSGDIENFGAISSPLTTSAVQKKIMTLARRVQNSMLFWIN